MLPTPHRFLLMLLLLLVASCASGSPTDISDLAQESDAALLGVFGDPCLAASDCSSRVCLEADLEIGTKGWCSSACGEEACPTGYACGTRDADQVCIPAGEYLCLECQNDGDCGGDGNRCIDYDGGRFCASDCANNSSSCPSGFSCQTRTDGQASLGLLCVSDTATCCMDNDGDVRGIGDGCRALDCNDEDPDIYDDALEVCDGKDNDCANGVDVGITDCGRAECRPGASGYFMRANETCIEGGCIAQPAVLCGLYTCADGASEGTACATSCDGEDMDKCVEEAHCDASVCIADLGHGDACDENSDCQSEHCANGFCCAFGDCCQQPNNCPSYGTFAAVCENPTTCQGARGEAVCSAQFSCATTGEEDDDSACDTQTIASNCGYYQPVFCNGLSEQGTPTCPTSCFNNSDCDDNAFCDEAIDECVADLGDGESCEADLQCRSAHCQNGFCCGGDSDCCASATDCPASYASSPVCTSETSCQGQRDRAECVDFSCTTTSDAPDDSACASTTLANDCGPYPSIRCNGSVAQDEPVCATNCGTNNDCDANAYCDAQGLCQLDEVDGSACQGDSQCTSDHCEGGFCCASGDCCSDNSDCSPLNAVPVCDSQSSCQGTRTDGVCSPAFQCNAVVVQDDSACIALPSTDCGQYQGIACTSAIDQPGDQASLCPSTCVTSAECNPSSRCVGNVCVPDQGQGGFCTDSGDCDTGLACIDSVCCSSTCSDTCQACDLDSSLGSCSTVAQGQDPDTECGPIDCEAYYWGWLDGGCFQKADLSAAAATCGGTNACASVVEECTAQVTRGAEATRCDSTCQSPNLSTCNGTTAGSCDDIDIGAATCGNGACEVTMDRCVSGAPQACVPNAAAATSEVCDGLDNDCDGSTDEGLAGDAYELNDTCGSNYYLGVLDEASTRSYTDMTLYSAGDVDWYRQLTSEDPGACTAGVDEEYLYEVLMTPPPGRDYDLQVCYNSYTDTTCTTDCYSSWNGGDTAETIALTWAGSCEATSNDGLNFFIRVYPYQNAASCEPYTLSTSFTKTN